MPLRFHSGANGTSIVWSNVTLAGSFHVASASMANDHGPLRLVQPLRRTNGRGYASGSGSFSITTFSPGQAGQRQCLSGARSRVGVFSYKFSFGPHGT